MPIALSALLTGLLVATSVCPPDGVNVTLTRWQYEQPHSRLCEYVRKLPHEYLGAVSSPKACRYGRRRVYERTRSSGSLAKHGYR